MTVNLRSLIGKLDHATRGAVESAAGLCLSRTHYDVEVEHYLMKLLDNTDSDASIVLKHFGVDRSRLSSDLQRALDKLKSGNARTPALSDRCPRPGTALPRRLCARPTLSTKSRVPSEFAESTS